MKRANRISAEDIRSNYQEHKKSEQDRNELMGYYIIRPLSFYPTAAFMNRGFTANQTTWISIVALLLGCLLLAMGSYWAAVAGAALLNIWVILDFVDGNIARYEQTSSRYGELIDALGAFVAHMVFLAAGIGFYFSSDEQLVSDSAWRSYPAVILILGAVASLAAIWIRLVYHKFKNTFPGSDLEKHEVVKVQETSSRSAIVLHAGHNLVNLSGFLLPLLFAAALLNMIDIFIVLLAVANMSILVISLIRILRLARECESAESAEAGK
jgi:phosphatidylglycerophosphate synthase